MPAGGGEGGRSLIWDKSMISPIGCYENFILDEKELSIVNFSHLSIRFCGNSSTWLTFSTGTYTSSFYK